jgi:hypothetical protein
MTLLDVGRNLEGRPHCGEAYYQFGASKGKMRSLDKLPTILHMDKKKIRLIQAQPHKLLRDEIGTTHLEGRAWFRATHALGLPLAKTLAVRAVRGDSCRAVHDDAICTIQRIPSLHDQLGVCCFKHSNSHDAGRDRRCLVESSSEGIGALKFAPNLETCPMLHK